ncbi:MAG: hypothetical protein AAB879_03825, partial [Patescibacteria group bacterium]
ADNLRKIKEKAAEGILTKKTEVKNDASAEEIINTRFLVEEKMVIHRRAQEEIERSTRMLADEKKRRIDALETKRTELRKEVDALSNRAQWARIAEDK